MQNKLLPVLILAAAAASGLRAQDSGVATPAPMQAAPAAQDQALQTAPTPNQVIYAPRLPTASEVSAVAAAQGLTIVQISQTSTQVTVITRNSAGLLNTVAYQLLPTSTAPAPTTTTVVTPAPAPTVIYETAPQVIYYDSAPYYYGPRYYSPPVSLSFGFGYSHFSGGHGGWHGGGRGWHR